MNDRANEVRKRIFHAHISGHSERGHLGDICLTKITPKQTDAYKVWLSTLQGLPSVEYVSLEFEAAKSMDEIDRSLQLLASWL